MNHKAELIRIASTLPKGEELRRAILAGLVKLSEEGGEDSASSGGKKKGPPPGWDEFMKANYDGGKKRVPNPNSKTKGKFKDVAMSTALKDPQVMKATMKEYSKWMEQNKKNDKGKDKGEGKKEEDEKKGDEKKDSGSAPKKKIQDSIKSMLLGNVQQLTGKSYQFDEKDTASLDQAYSDLIEAVGDEQYAKLVLSGIGGDQAAKKRMDEANQSKSTMQKDKDKAFETEKERIGAAGEFHKVLNKVIDKAHKSDFPDRNSKKATSTLSQNDRAALIRLASSLAPGSEQRQVILAELTNRK